MKFKVGDLVSRNPAFLTWGLGGGPMKVTSVGSTFGVYGDELIGLDNGHQYWHARKFEIANQIQEPVRPPHLYSHVIKAWADGHSVQRRVGDCWFTQSNPCWDEEVEWRIKPLNVD